MIAELFGRPVAFIAGCAVFATCLVASLSPLPASAHEPFEITTNVRVFSDRISLNVIITDSTAALLCLDGAAPKLHAKEFATEHSRIERCAAALYVVKRGGATLAPSAVQIHLSEEEDLDTTITYPAGTGDNLSFDAVHLARLQDPGYGATLTATGEGVFLGQKLLRANDSVIEVSLATKTENAHGSQSSFGSFLRLGIEHILTGYDHLLFLAGLLIVCRSLRTTLIIITAFTLAHSITLALAALNVVTIPSRIVEPFIAATIVFVGIENLLRAKSGEPRYRWLLTFAFGLMHGFGFASALTEAGLPPGGLDLVIPLLAFNLGVETGQLTVAAVFLPVLFWLRRKQWFMRYGIPAISVIVSMAGAWWLLQRTVL
jgi:hydrogenase/urease accessory protein HupE